MGILDISLTEKTSTSQYNCLMVVSLDRRSTREVADISSEAI